MSKSFQEYFCCAPNSANFTLRGCPVGDSVDISDHMNIVGHSVSLPFDLDEVVPFLRTEEYTGMMREEDTYLGTNPFFRKLYYWSRPILPVPIRSVLQRLK